MLILPGAWDFGTTLLGTSSPPHLFTVLNPGDVAVDIGAVTTTTSAFVLNDTNCGTTLAPQATCVADVSFVPTGTGLITGTLSIAASTPLTAFSSKSARKVASSPAATSALSGTGVVQAVLDLPSAIDFGAYTSGATPVRRVVTLRANGNAVLSLPSISATGPFVLGNDCPENMQPGDSCTLTLDFSAADLGNYTGTLVVVTNAVGGTRTIPLTARTVAIPAPLIQVSPASIGFGDRLLGSSEGSQRVTITNVGNDAAVLSPPLATTTDFLVTTTCGVTLAPSTSCFADVTFRPAGFGFRTGQLLINSNSVGSPNAIDLAGTGCRPFSSTMSRLGARFGCAP
ncbi:MAG TPA: choice-of-anchor D domain-containing protein [Usitatibacter sp.]